MALPNTPPTGAIWRWPRIHEETGLSRTTVWRLEKLHQFPQRVRISNQCVGWKSAEVDAWKASRQSADVMDPSVPAHETAIRASDEQR